MRVSKFWIFLLLILVVFAVTPQDLLERDISAFTRGKMSFSNKSPKQLEIETYDSIYEAFINLNDSIYVSKKLTSDQVFDIREKVISDNPEIFYLDYESSKYWSNGKLEFKYIDTKENILDMRKRIDEKANYVLSKIIKPDMSDLEKELAIHDYIVLSTEYDIDNYNKNTIPHSSHNVEGVLMDGRAVCEGYAKTFKMLLDKVGIESVIVSSQTMNHAWNMVLLDGEYYHVDATWNDPVPDRAGKVRHRYFNVSDRKMMQGDHRWNQEEYPKATNENYSHMWEK